MNVLGIILARAGSKGLPDKCVRELLGRPVIAYTFEHARASKLLSDVVFSTDSEAAKVIAREAGIEIIDRPARLASDTATVDAAARHAVVEWERHPPQLPPLVSREARRVDAVVLLYGNIPVRKPSLIDEAIDKLIQTGADSVRSVAPVTKQHPDWVHRLDGDRMVQFRTNNIYRRQDLSPLYYHDGAVVVFTRAALFAALETPDDHQSFLGRDRRAIACQPEDAVDIDGPVDLHQAEAVLRSRSNHRSSIVDRRVQIAGREIGVGKPVFVIAEAGVNHNGIVETALRMVEAAAEAGADAVKFQMFRACELATAQAPTAAYQRERCAAKSQRELLATLELTLADFERIARRCEEVGIALVITPFGVEDVARIKGLNHCSKSNGKQAGGNRVAAIKIASTDLTNGPLLNAAVGTEFPLILSTGASTAIEISEAVEGLRRVGTAELLILLHCISCYPTPVAVVNLRAIGELRRHFGAPVGLSDHTTAVEMGGWAAAAGACVLEKHFTLDRSAPGPDHGMSLTPHELKEYVRQLRLVESALGSGQLGMGAAENDTRAAARKSVVAAISIPAGTRLIQSMLTLKRPGTGIPPGDLVRLVGRETLDDIPNDTLLSWDMVR